MTTRHDTLLWRCHTAMRSPGVYPTDGSSMSLRCAHKWCHPIETEDWRQLRRHENNDVWCATTFVLLNGGFSVCAQSFKEYGRLCIFSCGIFKTWTGSVCAELQLYWVLGSFSFKRDWASSIILILLTPALWQCELKEKPKHIPVTQPVHSHT